MAFFLFMIVIIKIGDNDTYNSLKIWQLMATILMILLTVNWPNFVGFSIQMDVVSSGLS